MFKLFIVNFLSNTPYILLSIFGLHWVWTAIQISSFSMFAIGLIPICWIVTVPVGAYSLVVEVPSWVHATFWTPTGQLTDEIKLSEFGYNAISTFSSYVAYIDDVLDVAAILVNNDTVGIEGIDGDTTGSTVVINEGGDTANPTEVATVVNTTVIMDDIIPATPPTDVS